MQSRSIVSVKSCNLECRFAASVPYCRIECRATMATDYATNPNPNAPGSITSAQQSPTFCFLVIYHLGSGLGSDPGPPCRLDHCGEPRLACLAQKSLLSSSDGKHAIRKSWCLFLLNTDGVFSSIADVACVKYDALALVASKTLVAEIAKSIN